MNIGILKDDVRSLHNKKVAKDLIDSVRGFLKEEISDSIDKQIAIMKINEALDLIERAINKDLINRRGK